MKQKVPAFHKIPEIKNFIMLGEGTPVWVFLHFQAQPQAISLSQALNPGKTLKGGSFPSM
jgi:hypothetical protein